MKERVHSLPFLISLVLFPYRILYVWFLFTLNYKWAQGSRELNVTRNPVLCFCLIKINTRSLFYFTLTSPKQPDDRIVFQGSSVSFHLNLTQCSERNERSAVKFNEMKRGTEKEEKAIREMKPNKSVRSLLSFVHLPFVLFIFPYFISLFHSTRQGLCAVTSLLSIKHKASRGLIGNEKKTQPFCAFG